MASISELIRIESNGKLSFGDYTLASKAKLDNFEKDGDIYKVKRHLKKLLSLKKMAFSYMNRYLEQQFMIFMKLLRQ